MATDRDRVLVAGIGNIFFSDDGFGVEVVARLAQRPLPPGVRVADFGIRGLHLAYEMLEQEYEQVIFVDALPQQASPGELVLFEPSEAELAEAVPDPHAMTPATVLALLRTVGGAPPRLIVVGCQPETLEPGIGMSAAVAAAIEPAVKAIIGLLETGAQQRVSGDTGAGDRVLR